MDMTILELSEAAARLHATKHFVRSLINSGELPHLRVGKKFVIVAGDLNRWIETARARPGDAVPARRTSGKKRGKAILKAVKSAS